MVDEPFRMSTSFSKFNAVYFSKKQAVFVNILFNIFTIYCQDSWVNIQLMLSPKPNVFQQLTKQMVIFIILQRIKL